MSHISTPPQDPNFPTDTKPIKKIAAVGVGGVVLVIVVAILGGIAPGTFDSLGVWGPVVTAAVTSLALFLSGYIKKS